MSTATVFPPLKKKKTLRKMTKKEIEVEAAFAKEVYRRRGEINRLTVAVLSGKPVPMTIKLNAEELKIAHRQADSKGLREGPYLTGLVRDALERVDKNMPKPTRKRSGT
jgi:hypothetical protein